MINAKLTDLSENTYWCS